MAATDKATAAMNISNGDCPRAHPTPNVKQAKLKMAANNSRLNAAIFRVSGVSKASAADISLEIFPTSVRLPVANTTPRACP
jgi:hypothetical protein